MAGDHDVPLVRPLAAGSLLGAVHLGFEEVSTGVYTRRVDVVVLGEVAHCEWLERGC